MSLFSADFSSSQADSRLNEYDPRFRLALAGLLSAAIAVSSSLIAAFYALLLGVLLLVWARLHPKDALKRLLIVNSFIFFLWLLVPWTTPGAPLWAECALSPSRAGIELSLLVSLKANAVALVFMALSYGITLPTAGHALHRLGLPEKLVWLFLFMARYLHLLAEEWRTMERAALLRGFQPKANLHCYRTVATLLGILLVRAAQRGERINEAMRLRGFCGKFHCLSVFRVELRDLILASLLGLALSLLILFDYYR